MNNKFEKNVVKKINSTMVKDNVLNEGRVRNAIDALKSGYGRYGKPALNFAGRKIFDKTYRTGKSLMDLPGNAFTKPVMSPSEKVGDLIRDKSKLITDFKQGKFMGSKLDYIKKLSELDSQIKGEGSRIFAPGKALVTTVGTGSLLGVPWGLSKLGEDDINTKTIKTGVEGGSNEESGTIKKYTDGINRGITGVKNMAKATILVPMKLTADSIGLIAKFNQIKTPNELKDAFDMLYAKDPEVRKAVLSKVDGPTRLRWRKYYTSRKIGEGINAVQNAPTPVKAGLGVAAAGVGGLAAMKLKKEMDVNQAKVYGCDTIENPKQRIRCEIMVAKDDLREAKKFLAKCYDSNNPESCVKIYSQKIKEAEIRLAAAKNSINKI